MLYHPAGAEVSRPASSNSRSPLLPFSEGADLPISVASEQTSGSAERSSFASPAVVEEDTEIEKMVKNLRSGNQTEVSELRSQISLNADSHPSQRLDNLYAFMKANPDKEGEVTAALAAHMTPTFQTYVRRMLELRKNNENPCEWALPLFVLFIGLLIRVQPPPVSSQLLLNTLLALNPCRLLLSLFLPLPVNLLAPAGPAWPSMLTKMLLWMTSLHNIRISSEHRPWTVRPGLDLNHQQLKNERNQGEPLTKCSSQSRAQFPELKNTPRNSDVD